MFDVLARRPAGGNPRRELEVNRAQFAGEPQGLDGSEEQIPKRRLQLSRQILVVEIFGAAAYG